LHVHRHRRPRLGHENGLGFASRAPPLRGPDRDVREPDRPRFSFSGGPGRNGDGRGAPNEPDERDPDRRRPGRGQSPGQRPERTVRRGMGRQEPHEQRHRLRQPRGHGPGLLLRGPRDRPGLRHERWVLRRDLHDVPSQPPRVRAIARRDRRVSPERTRVRAHHGSRDRGRIRPGPGSSTDSLLPSRDPTTTSHYDRAGRAFFREPSSGCSACSPGGRIAPAGGPVGAARVVALGPPASAEPPFVSRRAAPKDLIRSPSRLPVPEASGDAPVGAAPVALSGPERSLLLALREREGSAMEEESLGREVGLPADQVRGSLQRLRSKHLALVEEEHETIPRLTPKGESALARGLPERRFLDALRQHGGSLTPDEVTAAGLDDEERSAAIGILRRRGFLAEGPPFRLKADARTSEGFLPEETVLKRVSEEGADADPAIVDALERRGLVRRDHRSIKRWSVSEEGRRLPLAPEGEELLGSLTPEILRSGSWRGRTFRPYDVRAAVPYLTGARPNPYMAWLEEFEEVLVGLGFEQAEGPLLETEFWNNDALFMPQDHPARSIHDALSVEGVEGKPPAP